MRGRFAPSPTGDLHLGGAFVAVAAWVRARAQDGGRALLRIEDLDRPRVVAGAADRILDDLEWLGLRWDEGPREGGAHAPYVQSLRGAWYDDAVAQLAAKGLVYPCTCTRAEIARAASAPHPGDESRYPGTCRDPRNRRGDRPAALRLRIPDDDRRVVAFDDGTRPGRNPRTEDVAAVVGDFVLRRADGVASYQLAVVVDDLAMEIDEVVRGDDLLPSTARQVLLARLLGGTVPRWVHLPMVLAPDGTRLAKRHQSQWSGSTIAELRAAGHTAAEVLAEMARALGLVDVADDIALDELVCAARVHDIAPTSSWTVPAAWIRAS